MKIFLDRVETLNKNSQGFGNEIIYNGCNNDLTQLQDPKKLTGTLWLIGRSYAASPQRRSYGTSKYIQPIKGRSKMPIWPITTENSGKGEFFDFLAEQISQNAQIEDIKEYLPKDKEYNFDCRDEDIVLLANVIKSVSIFNRLIKRATEEFDGVTDHEHTISAKYSITGKKETEYVYTKNQVSFCSKFLHFYRKDLVFIIDQFSKNGSTWMFKNSKKEGNFVLTLSEVNKTEGAEIEADVEVAVKIEGFQKDDIFQKYKEKIKDIKKHIRDLLKDEFKQDKQELENLEKNKGKKPKSKFIPITDDYIDHCIRSYLLCCILKEKEIAPAVSLPRLSDTIFMRIKHAKSEKEDQLIRAIYSGV